MGVMHKSVVCVTRLPEPRLSLLLLSSTRMAFVTWRHWGSRRHADLLSIHLQPAQTLWESYLLNEGLKEGGTELRNRVPAALCWVTDMW